MLLHHTYLSSGFIPTVYCVSSGQQVLFDSLRGHLLLSGATGSAVGYHLPPDRGQSCLRVWQVIIRAVIPVYYWLPLPLTGLLTSNGGGGLQRQKTWKKTSMKVVSTLQRSCCCSLRINCLDSFFSSSSFVFQKLQTSTSQPALAEVYWQRNVAWFLLSSLEVTRITCLADLVKSCTWW